MRLDSVRELKSALTSTLLGPLATSVTARRALNVAAQPLAEAAGLHRTVALGITKAGKGDFRLAVRVQRRAMENSPQLETVRKQAKDEVEVRYVGRVIKRALPWYQRRNRPLRVGGSIGHVKVTAGTLGCFVRDRDDGAALILSNNHVLADENHAKAGDAIIQPARDDQGRNPADRAGRLERFIRLKRIGVNLLDCAVASVDSDLRYDPRRVTGLGTLAGMGPDLLDEGVALAKAGRTTGVTRGRVTAFEMDNLVVGYDMGDIRFDNQIEVEGADAGPFSDGGDSGSLIVDGECRAVALLFCGSDQGGANGQGLTYGNPLRPVLDRLKVDLLY